MRPETAAPAAGSRAAEEPLVSIRDLQTYYSIRGSFVDRLVGREAGVVRAVDGVSLDIRRGEVLGLVGESGSGKTTLGRTLLGLVRATGGSAEFEGREITRLPEREFRALRRRMQVVFQDPHASLNPAMTIGQAVGHPLQIHGLERDRDRLRLRVAEVLERVGLAPADAYLDKFPGDLSGGQKQRAVIARALILNPVLLVADEPVSMLDMSVRAKILELMLALKRDFDLTYLYITHDLATARFFCDRIAIMYLGRIVEIGPAPAIYADPKHPYTRALLRAIPEPDPQRAVPRDLPRGEVPDASRPPLGCHFHPRCPLAFEPCGWESRDLRELLEARWARAAGEAGVEDEQALFGNLASLDKPSGEVRLPAPRGRSAEEMVAVLERIRSEAPDEPFWRGVRRLEAAGGRLELDFHDAQAPALAPAADVEVECHLYGRYGMSTASVAQPNLGSPTGEPSSGS
ncbi:MAG TPA: ABC transporter ATP-binding protein [Gaiellaceae bacterium]|jgi:peptide/nickel transport system ATP-binding protein|nr:ABC transporter ATP-binding protein [Gaiellaceae bacterium]